MRTNDRQVRIFFESPRLQAGMLGRILADWIFSIGKTLATTTAVVGVLSGADPLQWSGGLFLLIMLERAVHRNRGMKDLRHLSFDEDINLGEYLSAGAERTIVSAYDKAVLFGGNVQLHLVLKLLDHRDVRDALLLLDVPIDAFQEQAKDLFEKHKDIYKGYPETVAGTEALLADAMLVAKEGGRYSITVGDIFVALSNSSEVVIQQLFRLCDVEPEDVGRVFTLASMRQSMRFRRLLSSLHISTGSTKVKHRIMNRAWTARATPTLDTFSVDLTDRVRAGETSFFAGHDEPYERLLDILSYPDKPNVLFVGEPGSGGDELVLRLAERIVADDVPEQLFDKRTVLLDIGQLIAGADQGMLQERTQAVFKEVVEAGNIVLYIPHVHDLLRSGSGEVAIGEAILPFLTSNQFPVIGTTTMREFKQFIEQNSSFNDLFQKIILGDVSVEDAVRTVLYKGLLLEDAYKVTVTYGAIRTAVSLAERYFHDKPLTCAAEDILREAVTSATHRKDMVLNISDVVATVERRTNIPVHAAKKEEKETLLHLEELLHERLIGQDHAVTAVSQALREYRSGLVRQGGPIASFLFVGPTGVGKTELSKLLAEIQFGSETAMVRLDMSEYQERKSIERFIGSPDGSIVGALTEPIRMRPYSLILLDEFEKAHKSVTNLFLQVLDDGRLTDGAGRVVDFKNTIIIATSNAQSEGIKEAIEAGRTDTELSAFIKKELTHTFAPELVNRFSRVIIFKPLTKNELSEIVEIKLREIAKTLFESHSIAFDFERSVIERLAEQGYDPVFGARPLRTVLSERIKSVLAEELLKEHIGKGDTVSVSLGDDGVFKFEKK